MAQADPADTGSGPPATLSRSECGRGFRPERWYYCPTGETKRLLLRVVPEDKVR